MFYQKFLSLNSLTQNRKKYTYYFLLFSMLVFFFNQVKGQGAYSLPNIINPSPQSMAFTKYGDYPMATYAGMTDITIPIHTIKSRKLSMPITMGFHASGRMANEQDGILGMRWTLNCGGLVTRTMKGAPDEWTLLDPLNIDSITAYPFKTPSFDLLYAACPDGKMTGASIPNAYRYDSEFDIFSYALPNGKSGHFILKNVNGVKVPMIIPYEALKIEFVKDPTQYGNPGYFESVAITDNDGTKYFFGKISASTANAVETNTEYDAVGGQLGNVPTAWYLTKILSSDNTDEILLSYVTRDNTHLSASQSATIFDRYRNDDSQFWEYGNVDSYKIYLRQLLVMWHFEQSDVVVHQGTSGSYAPIVSAIQFNGGAVSLTYNNEKLLTEMNVNKNSVPFKKIKFNSSKHPGETLNYLDNISFYGESQNIVNEKYDFTYYAGTAEAPYTAVQRKDWWGYYNVSANHLLPYQVVMATPIPFCICDNSQAFGYDNGVLGRGANVEAKKLGMLKTITYPTGGQTEFIYEGNKYSYNEEGPGLRIAEVISKPLNGKNIHKIYKYGAGENGIGYINWLTTPGYPSRTELSTIEGNVMHYWTWVIANSTPTAYGGNLHTGYRSTVYYDDPYITSELSASYIKYNEVTEYYIEDNIPQQKTKSYYSWGDDEEVSSFIVHDYDQPIYHPRKFSDPKNSWLKPVLNNKIFYKYSNGQFDPVKNEHYDYEAVEKDNAWDMPTYNHTNLIYLIQYGNGVNGTDWYNTSKAYDEQNCSVYGYGLRNYKTGTQYIHQIRTEDISPAGTILTTKITELEPTYHFIRSEEITNSKSETVKTIYSYPHDFPNTTVYQQMVQKNILSPRIEQTSSVNNVQTKKATTNYFSPFTNIFVPQSVEFKSGNSTQEVIATFNKYDNKGNILEQQKANDVKEVYLWGYNSTYPVAKILNSTSNTVETYVTQSVLDNPSDDATLRSHLNNLRNINGALVTTYTYNPLVGITSETDPRGRTIYYEYDKFSRLILIKDNEGKVVKKICYNYAGQTEDCSYACPPNTPPIWQNTGNTRCQLDNTGQNTGYVEYEQTNINSCNTATTQWLLQTGGQNTALCPLPTLVNLTSTMTYSVSGYTASYYNISTGYTYSFSVSTASGLQSLGTIPAGNYNLTISRTTGAPITGLFKSGCFKQTITGTSATFYNVAVSSTTCNSITLTLGVD